MRRFVSLLLVAASQVAALAAEVQTLDGRFEDAVVAIVPKGDALVVKLARERPVPLARVLEVRFDERPAPPLTGVAALLVSGDELRGQFGSWDGKNLAIVTSSLGTVRVPVDTVAGFIIGIDGDKRRDVERELLAGPRPAKDILRLRDGTTIVGHFEKASDAGIEFDVGNNLGLRTFPAANVQAVVFTKDPGAAARPEPKRSRVRVRCADGSIVTASLKRLEDGRLEVEHALGPLSVAAREVRELLVLGGDFVWLSDLDPANVTETFPEGFDRAKEIFGWRRDKAVPDETPLRLGGRTFAKGLGVHSYSSLTYDLGEGHPFETLRVTIGLDDAVRHMGYPGVASVTFRVLLDGKPAPELPEGKVKARGEAPDNIIISLKGIRRLELVADYGNYLHVLGRADWAFAHLVRRSP